MTTLPRPRAILFDWDNTLIDSWGTIHAAWAVTLEAMGQIPWTLAEIKQRSHLSLRDHFPRLFGERWPEARQLYLDAYRALHLERLTAAPGAAELLAELVGAGFYLGVVSNKTGPVLRLEVEHLGWTRLFKRLVGSGDLALDKPDAAPILLALEGSGIACAEAWYVGDTALDMECAHNAGCVGVLLGAGEHSLEGLVKFPPALRFDACGALCGHLRGL